MTDKPQLPVLLPDLDKARRRSARLFNERLKLLAALLNTVGVGAFITTVIVPYASGRLSGPEVILFGFAAMMMLHGFAQVMMSLWKSEE